MKKTAAVANLRIMTVLLLGLLWCFSAMVSAADEKQEEAEAEDDEDVPAVLERPIYIPVKPAFVVNYGGVGKLKYLKLEISLRVKDTSASNAVRHHMPLLRDCLVTLFSRQMDQDIDTQEGKELIRVMALEGVRKVLIEEDGEEGVTDLFFNNFVIQR